jgi:ATP-dependent protease ClpP protease subunit
MRCSTRHADLPDSPFVHFFRTAKRHRRHLYWLLLLVMVPFVPASNASYTAAEVRFEDDAKEIILFRGQITRASVLELKRLLDLWQSAKPRNFDRPTVKLESPGGDVEAALEAGRTLRAAKATVLVFGPSTQAVCSSSCVFLVAGGVQRYVVGGLAIHNFFVTSKSDTYEQVATKRRILEQKVRAFLLEMNVSPQLYDQMTTIPAQKFRILSQSELDELGLGINDPTFHDFQLGEEASRRGVDKTVYIGRLGSLLQICGRPPSPPPLPNIDSLTRANLAAYYERERQFSMQKDQLEKSWFQCREDVLSGHRGR